MKWSLQQLHKYLGRPFTFQTTFDFTKEIENLDDILAISLVQVDGVGQNLYADRFKFDLHIVAVLTVEDARTLDPIEYPMDIKVTEIFDVELYADDTRVIEKNTIDLHDIVWEDIYLEKPLRIVKEEIPNFQQ